MDCKKIQDVIFNFVYGESSEAELEATRDHLEKCGDCARERQVIEKLLSKIKNCEPQESVSDDCRNRMLSKIKSSLGGEEAPG
ncbi:MAG: zf-HC2 domain-containing protein [bacterium]